MNRPRGSEEAQRTCIGCRTRRGQSEMTRLALGAGEDGRAVLWDSGRRLGGRGAWLCRNSRECLSLALKKKAFGRAFKINEALDLRKIL